MATVIPKKGQIVLTKEAFDAKAAAGELIPGAEYLISNIQYATAEELNNTATSLNTEIDAVENRVTETERQIGAIPEWAKQENKPTYTAEEVGALPNTTQYVSSVNGQSGAITDIATTEELNDVATSFNTKMSELQGQIDTKAPISLIQGDQILRGNLNASISDIDLNSKKGENGEIIIRGYNITNAPNVSIASVLVLPYTRDWVAQLYYDIGNNQIYTRTFTNANIWSAWKKIVTTDELNLANYPIGSIYMSTNSISPASIFGGTWERLKDRFLLAAGDTYAAGSTGGEAQHTLTTDEIPKHRHSSDSYQNGYPSTYLDGGKYCTWVNYGKTNNNEPDTSDGGPIRTSWVGGGQPHNNMPPYLAVYIWKRTA